MTVKELIIELQKCNMDSDVIIEVRSDNYSTFTVTKQFKVIDYIGACVLGEE